MAATSDTLSKEVKEKIFLEFMKYDKDRNGYVSFEEAHVILKEKLGYTQSATKSLLNMCDRNGDGQLSYDEFVQFYMKVHQRVDEIKSIFNEIDENKDGYITMDEAKCALRNMAFNDDEIESLVRAYDANDDGCLQYEEFIRFWTSL